MEQAQTTEKPQQGAWDNTQAYPQKIKFLQDKPVVVTFSEDFTKPKEMPNTSSDGVFYVFECMSEGVNSSIMTSSWTMLRSLKSHSPLAGKTLIITKKNVGGKNMFYVETPAQNESRNAATPEPSEVDSEEAGINSDSTM